MLPASENLALKIGGQKRQASYLAIMLGRWRDGADEFAS